MQNTLLTLWLLVLLGAAVTAGGVIDVERASPHCGGIAVLIIDP